MIFILYWFTLITAIAAQKFTFPTFLLSHRLVPGLRDTLTHSEQLPFTLRETTNIINRELEECSSDAYVFVNQPGLKLEDFETFKNFVNLRRYMAQYSTIVTFPNTVIDDQQDQEYSLDFEQIEKTLKIHCNTQTMKVLYDDEKEVPEYIDTRKRLIYVDLSQLPRNNEEMRTQMLQEHDELIYKIIRKLPSPHVTIIYTTNIPTEYTETSIDKDEYIVTQDRLPLDPQDLDQDFKQAVIDSKTSIFPDISLFDRTRYIEFERNDKGEKHDYSEWAKDKDKEVPEDETWATRKKRNIVVPPEMTRFGELEKSAPSIFNRDLILDNALLIAGGFFLLVILVGVDVLKMVVRVSKSVFGKNQKAKTQ